MKINLIVITLCILISSGNSYGSTDQTGKTLLAECQAVEATIESKVASKNEFSQGYCVGVIQGMRYMSLIYEVNHRLKTPLYCIPENTTVETLIRVVVNYLNNNPAKLHLNEGFLIASSFEATYACT